MLRGRRQESCTLGNSLTEGGFASGCSRRGIGFFSANPSQAIGVVFCFHRWFTDEERRRHHMHIILWVLALCLFPYAGKSLFSFVLGNFSELSSTQSSLREALTTRRLRFLFT